MRSNGRCWKGSHVRYLSADEETLLREALLGREAKLREARDRFNAWRTARGRHALPRRAEEFVDYLRPVVLVALNTGLRRGEILQLEWKDVDLDGKWITVSGAGMAPVSQPSCVGSTVRELMGHADITMVLRYAASMLMTWQERLRRHILLYMSS